MSEQEKPEVEVTSAQEEWDAASPRQRARLCGRAGIGPFQVLTKKAFAALDLECQRRLNVHYADRMNTEADSVAAEKKFTADQILELVQRDDSSGLCVDCGAEASGVEPDARRYRCECCGHMAVYGAEELLIMTQG